MQDIIPPEKVSDVPIIVNFAIGQNWGEMK
jgi:hypothetical protein